jgi:prepilin-type N-terminal cleavage/methylation domain-containing protein
MKKSGFTLVELLAVIVILAVILAIAIPSISTMMNSASKNALESSAKLVLKGIEYEMMENSTFDPTSVTEANIKSTLNIDNSNYQSVTVKKANDTLYVTIVGKNKWDKLTVSGTKLATKVADTVTSFSYGANVPVLATGMTPIKWDGSAWVDTTEADSGWYNYDTTNKQWANARTADGSMWVWIPRYIYKIPTANWHTSTVGTIDIQFSKGIDDNWNKAVIGNINLDQTANGSKGTWTNHPAFTFGDSELTGFWIAKFEASSSNPAATNGGGNVTNLKVKSIPNVVSWRGITVNNIFAVIRSMETDNTYGWGTTGNDIDTHMMKNSEWGAVTYLTQSTYGKNAEVWINNSNTFTTGCAGDSVSDAASTTGCEYAYNTTNGLQASTTGNIYGIYDISGGSWECTSDYVDNGHTNLNNGSVILSADSKYKEIYSKAPTDSDVNNYALAISHKGIAVYETSSTGSVSTSWNGDYSNMPRTDQPWFLRGRTYSNGANAGTFGFGYSTGSAYSDIGFRSSVLVGAGL